MKPTPQQLEVVNWKRPAGSNLVVEALAGTGKTSTLKLFVQNRPGAQFTNLAFNKRIAEYLNEIMPSNTTNKTFHAFGLAAYARGAGKRPKVKGGNRTKEDSKFIEICDAMQIFAPEECPDLKRLISIAKANGAGPRGMKAVKPLVISDDDFWESMKLHFAFDTGDYEGKELTALCHEFLQRDVELSWNGVIDFDDMLYMPIIAHFPFPSTIYVLVDEAQDVSAIQLEMINRIKSQHFIAIGDRFQSIYAFRGADSDAIPRIIREKNAEILPLTVSFRCSRKVIEEAQRFVPTIEHAEHAIEGVVDHIPRWSKKDLQHGDAILCRNTAPLVNICFSLIRQRVAATIVGRDIGETLVKVIDILEGKKGRKRGVELELSEFIKKLEIYRKQEGQKLIAKGRFGLLSQLDDRCEALKALAEGIGLTSTTRHLRFEVRNMFSEENSPITLSTIHKSKGREWPRVFFLDKFLIPSRFAETDEALQQEDNISYVGITRAKAELHYVESNTFGGNT